MRMIKDSIFYRVAVAVMAFYALLAASCEKPESVAVAEVSVLDSEVSREKGSMFVNVKCSGDWTLSLQGDSAEVDWATLSPVSGTGNKANVVLKYDENSTGESRSLTIMISSGSRWNKCRVTQHTEGDVIQDGYKGMDPTETDWLELPAMDDPDLGYYAHWFEMNDRRYRNYSFGWSQEDRVALWVAYPLCRLYTSGNAGRTNAWALDPLLGELSAAPFGGYAGYYARGHQLPSADRQCCREANEQTFYGTNMTPQLNEHNEGIWAALESRVREYANSSDTLYVVTGVVVSPSSLKEKDSYKNSVTVPDAYFKALLKYKKTSTLGDWNAIAFWLDHKEYSGGIQKSHSMSIDALEELTGLDFFVNLPAKVGEDMAANLEAQDPKNSSVWW